MELITRESDNANATHALGTGVDMRSIRAAAALLLLAGCNGFVGEISTEKPSGPAIVVVNPNYVLLRPVTSLETQGLASAPVYGQTVYFRPEERILDLTNLDLRTAKVEIRHGTPERYIVAVQTNPVGKQLLHEWTSAHIEKQVGVFIDGQLISAPIIESPIDEMIVLDGDFTKAQAESVVARLRHGGAG